MSEERNTNQGESTEPIIRDPISRGIRDAGLSISHMQSEFDQAIWHEGITYTLTPAPVPRSRCAFAPTLRVGNKTICRLDGMSYFRALRACNLIADLMHNEGADVTVKP